MSGNRRRASDVFKLVRMGYEVDMEDGNTTEFIVKFKGPKDSLYTGGTWRVSVELPTEYPLKSPSIAFTNRIYHPNIEWNSGAVCLDVLNQYWSPMFDLHNVFDAFLPQLLNYPNCSDPLNGPAASQMRSDEHGYGEIVKRFVKEFASDGQGPSEGNTHNNKDNTDNNIDDDDDDDSSIASLSDSD